MAPPLSLAGLSLLLLEDDSLLSKQIRARLDQLKTEVTTAASLKDAKSALARQSFDFALLDVRLPDGLGTSLLQSLPAATAAVIMTAEGGVEGAVEAMRLGAADYLVKPFDLDELHLVLQRARRTRQSARIDEHHRASTDQAGQDFFFGQALGPLQKQLAKIIEADQRVVSPLPPILIEGETGTGKTTLARILHHRGPRNRQPLVEVNCSALPEPLAESELFGHERGAFTDARATRIGLFEAAHEGTLFLDELPSLSLPLQAKVLKVVEDQRIRRLGGNKEISVDVRIIAATHQNLSELVSQNAFREDLYHRLDLYRLLIPPLRQRGQDLLKLAEQLIAQISKRHRLEPKPVSHAGQQRLLNHSWPGNVRELAHELERAIVFEEQTPLQFSNLRSPESRPTAQHNAWFNPDFVFPQDGFNLEDATQHLIHHALAQSQNNVSAAARLLGVSRDFLRYRLSKDPNH